MTVDGVSVNVASAAVTVKTVAGLASVDTQALSDAVAAAEKLNRGDYTAETWAPFAKALTAARAQLVNPESQAAVNGALEALVAAQSALAEANVDTAALQDAIVAADKLVESDYTADSWKAFSAALAAAEQQLANPTSSADVSAALDALTKAQAGLVKVAAGTPGDKAPTGETPANGTPGANNGAGGNAGGSASATSSPAGGTLSQTGDAVPVAPLAATGVSGAVAAAIAAFFARRKNRE